MFSHPKGKLFEVTYLLQKWKNKQTFKQTLSFLLTPKIKKQNLLIKFFPSLFNFWCFHLFFGCNLLTATFGWCDCLGVFRRLFAVKQTFKNFAVHRGSVWVESDKSFQLVPELPILFLSARTMASKMKTKNRMFNKKKKNNTNGDNNNVHFYS